MSRPTFSMSIPQVVILTGLSFFFVPSSQAQYGTLDPTFASVGYTTIAVDASSSADDVAVQPDGKVVMIGTTYDGFDRDMAVVRFMSDGTLDTGFGTDGVVKVEFGPDDDCFAQAILLRSDGRILVGGTAEPDGSTNHFALAQLTPNGALDPSFNFDGLVLTNFGVVGSVLTDLALRPDGSIVAIGRLLNGSPEESNAMVVSFLADGTLDLGFGGTGWVEIERPGDDIYNAVALDLLGNIVLAGSDEGDIVIARILVDGSMDPAFSFDGFVTTFMGVASDAIGLAIRSDGKIVVSGTHFAGQFTIARYHPNGALDLSFDSDGILVEVIPDHLAYVLAMVLGPDDTLLMAGAGRLIEDGGDDHLLICRLEDGSPCPDFGTGGHTITTIAIDEGDEAEAIALAPDGAIVVAGDMTDPNSIDRMVVARYQGNIGTGLRPIAQSSSVLMVMNDPLADRITFSYVLEYSQQLRCELFDAQGRTVQQVFPQAMRATGRHYEEFHTTGLAAGYYQLVLSSATGRSSAPVIVR